MVPVIARIARELPDVAISVDTRRALVAAAAIDAGASIVNDVSSGWDPAMFGLVRDRRAALVLMHMKGEPRTMQEAPSYDDVVSEVHDYLGERLEVALRAGIDSDRVAVDPGIGFGKDLGHNLELLRRIDALLDLGRPVLVGPSRKRFIGSILDLPEDQRVEGTIGAVGWAVAHGARIVRVHDVREVARAVRVLDAIAGSGA
jgi:dihydropteroate synthase